jgi:hypothetical protein
MEVKSVFIIKDGVHNCVDENMFERVYKPAGWKLCDSHYNEVVEVEEVKAVGTAKPEAVEEVKNITAMNKKKRTNNKFNDNLIKQ